MGSSGSAPGRAPERGARSDERGAPESPFTLDLLTRGSEDIAAVDAIAHASFDERGFSAERELERPWARIWVARITPHDDAPSAFLIAWHVADELHILNVATAPAARRRGLGAALMDAALAYAVASGVRLLLLEVRRSNKAAIRLYRRLGFTALGVRPGYYADNGEDAIEMMLELDVETGRIIPGRDEIRIDG